MPDGGLLLAHHPLLLRGVDTVAASTAKGALLHQMIRTGRALFTAHTNADSASPGVSDALAEALGLDVEEVLAPLPAGRDLDKWVVFVPAENADAVREAMFAAGGGHIGDYSHCSWSVAGTGQFLPHDGASPAIGSVGTVERVPEERVEVIAPARLRGHVLAAMRAAHPYEEPAFDVFALAPVPGDVGLGRIGSLPTPEPLSAFVSRVRDALPGTSWGVRAAGDADATVSRVAVCGGAGDSLLDVVAAPACRPTSPLICGTIPPTNTGARPTWRWSTSRIGPVSSHGAPRRRMSCAVSSVIRYRCGYQWSAPIRGMSRETGHES